jgi:hypothetical protein
MGHYGVKRFPLALVVAVSVFATVTPVGGAVAKAPPTNDVAPSITGRTQEGSTLTAHPGDWSGTRPITFSFRWHRCDPRGGPCMRLRETSERYNLGRNDVGKTLFVEVTGRNAEGSRTVPSAQTAVIAPASAQAPRNTTPPSIGGVPREGQVLTADPGAWSGSVPIQFSYRWRRCDTRGGACVDLRETSRNYRLGANDVGRTLRVVVTATNGTGSATAVSNPSGTIAGAAPPAGQCQPIASVSLPNRLLIDRIQYSPPVIRQHGETLVARFHVTVTTGVCVSGALVYAVGVPFDRLTAAPEVQTGSDGWAEVTFRVKPTFPLRRGNLVVIFVRARKPGDSVLAGVSTRRLVSVRVG